MNKLMQGAIAFITRDSSKSYLPRMTYKHSNLRLMDLYILKHLERPLTQQQLNREYNSVPGRPKAADSSIRRRRASLTAMGFIEQEGFVSGKTDLRKIAIWRAL